MCLLLHIHYYEQKYEPTSVLGLLPNWTKTPWFGQEVLSHSVSHCQWRYWVWCKQDKLLFSGQKIERGSLCSRSTFSPKWGGGGEAPPELFGEGAPKITADSDCSHEMKRCLLLGRKVMTNLDSIFKSRDITLPTKVHLVKVMVFPVIMFGCESWTVKKAEHWRIDAFELWCWRRLLRVP